MSHSGIGEGALSADGLYNSFHHPKQNYLSLDTKKSPIAVHGREQTDVPKELDFFFHLAASGVPIMVQVQGPCIILDSEY